MVTRGPSNPGTGVPQVGDPCLFCMKPIRGDWLVVEHPHGVCLACQWPWARLSPEERAGRIRAAKLKASAEPLEETQPGISVNVKAAPRSPDKD